jgi:hypothetical protein
MLTSYLHRTMLVVSLLVLVACASCEVIYFNNAAGPRCASTNDVSCVFNDPTLWSSGTVPANGDDVYITVGQPGYDIALEFVYLFFSLCVF